MSKDQYVLGSENGFVIAKVNLQPAGYLIIAGSLRIAVSKKPEEKHLQAMAETFGWQWEDL